MLNCLFYSLLTKEYDLLYVIEVLYLKKNVIPALYFHIRLTFLHVLKYCFLHIQNVLDKQKHCNEVLVFCNIIIVVKVYCLYPTVEVIALKCLYNVILHIRSSFFQRTYSKSLHYLVCRGFMFWRKIIQYPIIPIIFFTDF